MTRVSYPALLLIAGVVLQAAIGARSEQSQARSAKPGVTRASFGKTLDGTTVDVYTLTNKQGVEIKAISYGGIIQSIRVPDRSGRFDDVVLGFDRVEEYLKQHPYFGAIVGRYGNRIGKAQFTLDGRTSRLAANNGPNHLHGGLKGFDKVV